MSRKRGQEYSGWVNTGAKGWSRYQPDCHLRGAHEQQQLDQVRCLPSLLGGGFWESWFPSAGPLFPLWENLGPGDIGSAHQLHGPPWRAVEILLFHTGPLNAQTWLLWFKQPRTGSAHPITAMPTHALQSSLWNSFCAKSLESRPVNKQIWPCLSRPAQWSRCSYFSYLLRRTLNLLRTWLWPWPWHS